MSNPADNSAGPPVAASNSQHPSTETTQPNDPSGARRKPLEQLPSDPDGAPDDGKLASLPFTHATTFDALEQILDGGFVQPNACGVFGERLVYLFYGRFAYRIEMEENLNRLSNDGPVALIFDGATIRNLSLRRVFPFDSGGYGQFYQNALGQLHISDYQLSDLVHADRIICFCWSKSKAAYFWFDTDRLRAINSIPATKRHWRMYLGVLHGLANRDGDDRRGTIEVSSEHPIPVNQSTLIGMVIPRKFYSHEKIIALQKAGVRVKAYPHFANRPNEQFGSIRERVCEILVDSGCLDAGCEDGA
jgi:hypothetical protein